MAVYVALLRAVNVGGTGKLLMSELRALCAEAGFDDPKTYIQTGNLLLTTDRSEAELKVTLEAALEAKMGKPVGVVVRTRAELESVVERNPYSQVAGNRVLILFIDQPPPADLLDGVSAPAAEELTLDGRELFIHFPEGMGRSKLKIPMADQGTGRNLNTVRKLAVMAREREREVAE